MYQHSNKFTRAVCVISAMVVLPMLLPAQSNTRRADVSPPTLLLIAPAHIAQGTSVQVTLNGNGLVDGSVINTTQPGITVTNVQTVPNAPLNILLTATFTVAPDAPLGPADVTVTTPAGTSAPISFSVVAPTDLICTAVAGVPPIVRAEGAAEPAGDVAIDCTGGDPLSGPQPITITATLDAFVSSRVTSGTFTDALLLVNEPVGGALKPCPPNATCDATYNAYQGQLANAGTGPDGDLVYRSIVWSAVPFTPPGNGTITLRLTNIRADARSAQPPPGPGIPQTIRLTLNISGGFTFQVAPSSPLPVAYLQPAIANGIVSGGAAFQQCSGQNVSLMQDGGSADSIQFGVTLLEGFASSWRTIGGPEQSTPGTNYFTESLFTSAAFGGGNLIGHADQASRFSVSFTGIQSGVRVYVPVNIPLFRGSDGLLTGSAQLLTCDVSGKTCTDAISTATASPELLSAPPFSGAAKTAVMSYYASDGARLASITPSQPLIYEIRSPDPYTGAFVVETAAIPLAVAYQAGVAATGATGPTLSFAMVPLIPDASAAILPVPRFGAFDLSPVALPFTVASCSSLSATSSLSFVYQIGHAAPPTQSIAVTSASPSSGVAVSSSTSGDCSWLALSPTTGATPFSPVVTVNPAGVTAGTHQCSITFSAADVNAATTSVSLTVANPTSISAPSVASFSYRIGGPTPAARTISVTSANPAAGVSVTSKLGGSCEWLALSVAAGTTPFTVPVSAKTAGLSPGSYSCTITFSGGNASAATTATLDVLRPALVAAPARLNFIVSGRSPMPVPQQIQVTDAAGGAVPYTVSASQHLRLLSPFADTTPSTILVAVNPAGLAAGTNSATVTITPAQSSGAEIVTMPVTISVSTLPLLTAMPRAISFELQHGTATATESLAVFAADSSIPFVASAKSTGAWLNVSPTGLTPGSVTVTANASGLSAGTYFGQITIATSQSTAPPSMTVPVTLTVAPRAEPKLSVSADAVQVFHSQGDRPDLHHLIVLNAGGGTLSYRAQTETSSCGPWLSILNGSGTVTATSSAPGVISFETDASAVLNEGTCPGFIRITNLDDRRESSTVPVTMAVTGASKSLLLPQTALIFRAVANGPAPSHQSFTVRNAGTGSLGWTIKKSTLTGTPDWLAAVTPGSGAVEAGTAATVTVGVDPVKVAALAPGLYYEMLDVSAPDAPNGHQAVTAILILGYPGQQPSPALTPAGVILAGTSGSALSSAEEVVLVNDAGTQTSFASSVITDNGQHWLAVTPPSGSIAADGVTKLKLEANLAGLGAGIRNALLRISFADGTVHTVAVAVVVGIRTPADTGTGGCGPDKIAVQFVEPEQDGRLTARIPATLKLKAVDCSNNPVTDGSATVQIGDGNRFVSLVAEGNGIWSATWTPDQSVSFLKLTGRVFAGPASGAAVRKLEVAAGAGKPAAAVVRIYNGGSFAVPGEIAPGTWVSIFGDGLATAKTVTQEPFPPQANGTRVLLNGESLLLSYLSPTQINALVPSGITPNQRHQLLVIRDGTISAGTDVLVADVQPGLFSIAGAGTGQGAVLIAGTATLAAPTASAADLDARPVHRGEYISIFATGLGPVTNPPPDGTVAGSDPLSMTTLIPIVKIGGIDAPVTACGLTPTAVGLYFVNVKVPEGVEPGDAVSVVLTIGAGTSNPVTIAVD